MLLYLVGEFYSKRLLFSCIPFLLPLQVKNGLVLPDKASLYLTAIEDADYKDEKIECEIEHTSSP